MKHAFIILFLFAGFWSPAQDAIITGVIDGPLSGGTPKAIEVFVLNAIPDLSVLGVSRRSNGASSTASPKFMLSGAAQQGDFIYISDEAVNFQAFFGFMPTFTSSQADINGDDGIELYQDGNLIDEFGAEGVDGSGEDWEYLDGWAYRETGTQPNTTFTISEWMFSLPNALDRETVNSSANKPFPIATFKLDSKPKIIVSTERISISETGTAGSIEISLSEAPASDVTLNIASGDIGEVTVSPASLVFSPQNGTVPQLLTISGVDDGAQDGSQEIELIITVDDANSDDSFDGQQAVVAVLVSDGGEGSYDLISTIQGSGERIQQGDYTIRGIVTAIFDDFNGFFVQEEDIDWDDDPASSEGIFVYTGSGSTPSTSVSVRDEVVISGTADESFDQSQLEDVQISVLSKNSPLPSKTDLVLPVSSLEDFEQYEGMLVNLVGNESNLVVNNVFNLGQFGQTQVSVGGDLGGRFLQFTQQNKPDISGFKSFQDKMAKGSMLIDDGRSGSNKFPVFYARGGQNLSPTNTLRAGDEIESVEGVVSFIFDSYTIQPTKAVAYQATNKRPTAPPNIGGNLRVASMNLLNFFNTIGERGAATDGDLEVQTAKLVAAFESINADIVAIQEIENDGFGLNSSIQQLVTELNDKLGADTYSFVKHASGSVGDDEIAVGIVFKPSVVTESGTSALLGSSNFTGERTNRSPLAQTFMHTASGETFSVVSVHMKSKGGNGTGANADAGDGAGNFNQMRLDGVKDMRNWLATNPTGISTDKVIILGDFNAYAMEDPIQDMVSNGYTNLFSSASTYSFSFGGQWGSLDYAFTSNALNDKLSGAAKLHINADEPRALSYSTKFDDAALRDNSFYRSSDHDPLVIGFNLSDESGSTKISALATCAGVTTNDTYFIQVSSLEVGKNYAFDFDKDGKVDEQLVARNEKERLTTSFNFKNGQVALPIAIDIDFEEGRFSSDVDILVHEIKCIDIDGDGTIDNNIAICNPNATGEKGAIIAQSAPYNGVNTYVYVLTNNSNTIITNNTTGYFGGLSNDSDPSDAAMNAYKCFAYNVLPSDLAAFQGLLGDGEDVTTIDFSSIECYTHCTANGAPSFKVGCEGCPVITNIKTPTSACLGSGFNVDFEAVNLSKVQNEDTDFGVHFYFWEGSATPQNPYDGSQMGRLGSVTFSSLSKEQESYTFSLKEVGKSLEANTYQICAVLNGTPEEQTCRPSLCKTLTIEQKPILAIAKNGLEAVCSNATQFDLMANASHSGRVEWRTTNGKGQVNGASYTIHSTDKENSPIRFEATANGVGTCSAAVANAVILLNISDNSCGTFPWNGN